MASELGSPVAAIITAGSTTVDTLAMTIVNTTSSTAVSSTGSHTITVASATNLVTGMDLTIDAGSNQEIITNVTVSGTSVTGTFALTHSGTYAVTFIPARQIVAIGDPTTATNIQAVNSSGAASANLSQVGGTNVALGQTTMSASLPVVLPSNQSNVPVVQNDTFSTGNSLNMTSTSNAITVTVNNSAVLRFQISGGTWTGTIIFEASVDESNWVAVNATLSGTSPTVSSTTTSNGTYRVDGSGWQQVRARCSVTGTNSATVAYSQTAASVSPVTSADANANLKVNVNVALPAGTNNIGIVSTPMAGNADGQSAAANQGVALVGYNGSTWDRLNAQAVGTDPGSGAKGALVVQGSASGVAVPISLPYATVITGSITASGTANGVVGTISSPTILVTVHGTYNAILQFHASDDAGTTYYPVSAWRTDGTDTAEQTTQTMANASTSWYVKADGFNRLRVYASTYTSGTVSVRMTPVMISMPAPTPPLGKAGTWASLPTTGTTSTPVVVGTGPPSVYSGMEIRLTNGATAPSVQYGVTMTGTAPSSPGASAFVTVTGPTAAPDIPPIYIPLISPAQPYFAAVSGTTTPQYRWI